MLLAMKTHQSVQATLGISNSRHPFFISVSDRILFVVSTFSLTGSGFMTKIKKLLEMVCFSCGKILVDEVSHP